MRADLFESLIHLVHRWEFARGWWNKEAAAVSALTQGILPGCLLSSSLMSLFSCPTLVLYPKSASLMKSYITLGMD